MAVLTNIEGHPTNILYLEREQAFAMCVCGGESHVTSLGYQSIAGDKIAIITTAPTPLLLKSHHIIKAMMSHAQNVPD